MSQKPIIAFTCPTCCNHTVYSTEQDVRDVSQIKKGEVFVCDECGEEFTARPSNSGKTVKFIRRGAR